MNEFFQNNKLVHILSGVFPHNDNKHRTKVPFHLLAQTGANKVACY